jgi:hypothetical protein
MVKSSTDLVLPKESAIMVCYLLGSVGWIVAH